MKRFTLCLLGIFWCALGEAAEEAPRLLVAALQIDGEAADETIYLYEIDTADGERRWLLPLGELARAFGLGITIDMASRTAQGFVLEERAIFRLTLAAQQVQWAGRRESFESQQVWWLDDELYVALPTLQRWWPIDFSFDASRLLLQARPRQPLPLRLREARAREAQRRLAQRAQPEPAYPLIPVEPYRWISTPAWDSSVTLGLAREPLGLRHSFAYTALLAGDLLGMEAAAQGSLRRRSEDPGVLEGEARWSLSRHDPQGRLFGRLGATRLQLGQVSLPPLKMRSAARGSSWAALLSNRPLDRPLRPGVHTLRGWLAEDWDVTLFHNDALVGFLRGTANGTYEFADQPLFFGHNEFRLEFNGPHGQHRRETQVYLLDPAVTAPGHFHYTVGVHDGEEGWHSLVQGEWGLARGLALGATAGGPRGVDYGQLGLRTALGGSRVDVDQGWSVDGSRYTEWSVTSRVREMSLVAVRSRFEGPASPTRQGRDEWRLAGALPLPTQRRIPYTLAVQRESTGVLDLEPTIYLNLGGPRGAGLNVAQALRYRTSAGISRWHSTTRWNLQAAQWLISGQVGYTLAPHSQLETAGLSLARQFPGQQRLSLGLGWSPESESARATLQWSKTLRASSVGLQLRWSGRDRIDASLQWMQTRSLASSGAVAATVFIDGNGNGRFDRDEERIEHAGFLVNGAPRAEVRTDASGMALLPRLSPTTSTTIALDPASLEEIAWQPARAGVRVWPRPGRVQRLEFPVVVTSEIEGRVLRGASDVETVLVNLPVQLLDPSGGVLQEVRSLDEGDFLFEQVKPGRYRLRLDPLALSRRGFAASEVVDIEIGSAGGEVQRIDFTIVAATGT